MFLSARCHLMSRAEKKENNGGLWIQQLLHFLSNCWSLVLTNEINCSSSRIRFHLKMENFPHCWTMAPTWLNQLCIAIASSLMVNAWTVGIRGIIFPTFTLWNDWFDRLIQLITSYPMSISPSWLKEISSPALLLNETRIRKWWN